MLIQFSVENFLSIKDKVILSLLASKGFLFCHYQIYRCISLSHRLPSKFPFQRIYFAFALIFHKIRAIIYKRKGLGGRLC